MQVGAILAACGEMGLATENAQVCKSPRPTCGEGVYAAIFNPSCVFFHTEIERVRRVILFSGNLLEADGRRSPWPLVVLDVAGSKPDGKNGLPPVIEMVRDPSRNAFNPARARLKASKVFEATKSMDAATSTSLPQTPKLEHNRMYRHKGPQVVETCPEFYNELDKIFSFSFDPCPVHPSRDAMTAKWGKRNYVNPPFSHAGAFGVKASEEAARFGARTVMLCPANTSTNWFSHLAGMGYLRGVVMLRGRVKFKGFQSGLRIPLMLMVFGPPRPVDLETGNLAPRLFSLDTTGKEDSCNTLLSNFELLHWIK